MAPLRVSRRTGGTGPRGGPAVAVPWCRCPGDHGSPDHMITQVGDVGHVNENDAGSCDDVAISG
jgi:hypothetical protein